MKGAEEKRARGNKYKASAVPIPLLLWSLESGLSLCCFFCPLLGIDDGKSRRRRSFQAGTRRAVAVGRKRAVSHTITSLFSFFSFFFCLAIFCTVATLARCLSPTQIHTDFAITGDTLPQKRGEFWRIIF
jgi:hypothetical protein